MAAYIITAYDITNPEEFKQYGPKLFPLIKKYGGEILAADNSPVALEGSTKSIHSILKFPSYEDAMKLYNDPAYEEIKNIRMNSAKNHSVIVLKEFKL